MSYKKRDKGQWNQGKAYKGNRKAKEKEHVKRDIQQQIDEQVKDYKYPYKSKTTRDYKKRLENLINWYEKVLARLHHRDAHNWLTNSFRATLSTLKKKWKDKYDEENKWSRFLQLRTCPIRVLKT